MLANIFIALALVQAPSFSHSVAVIERGNGGRLGVFVLDTATGKSSGYREDERFLMCSTFKIILVGDTLSRASLGLEQLDSPVYYTKADLLDHAPVTRAHIAEGHLSVDELCGAAIEVSDNTAANLLLKRAGGPHALTTFARTLGDGITRFDRTEPTLNRPNGVMDTTSPRAMVYTAHTILLTSALRAIIRAELIDWMRDCTTGRQCLRAGVPPDWVVGDKSGSGTGINNDVAVVYPPNRRALLVAAYYEAPKLTVEQRQKVLSKVGALAAHWCKSEAGSKPL